MRTFKMNAFRQTGFHMETSYMSFYSSKGYIHKIFEANSSFDKSFLLVLTEFLFWQMDWVLGYHSMEFWDFPDIS